MKHLKFLWLVGFVAPMVYAQAGTQLSQINQRLTSIESRLDIIEKQLKEVRIKTRLEELPLKQPNITQDELLKWTTDSILEIYSYNYLNYQQVLKNIRPLFTKAGYDSYMTALQESKNLEAVKNKKLVVIGVPSGLSQIINEKTVNSVYTWEVQIPLMVAYQSAEKEIQQRIIVTAEVVREPYSDALMGVAIHAITAKLEDPKQTQEKAETHNEKEDALQSSDDLKSKTTDQASDEEMPAIDASKM